ncbi:MAG: hypothetical protein ABEJ82_09980 [Haloplanus sp.]
MAGRYGNVDYSRLTRGGFALGVALFVLGGAGELVGQTFGVLPAWGSNLLFDAEVVGVVTMLCVPVVFGVLLPLTE